MWVPAGWNPNMWLREGPLLLLLRLSRALTRDPGPHPAVTADSWRHPWMTEPLFHCLHWVGEIVLLFILEGVMRGYAAGEGLWGWALVLLQTGVAFCFSLILLCPTVVVELLLLDVGLGAAGVSMVLNYFVLFVWDLHGTWDLLVGLPPGWVWPCLGLVQLLLGLIFCITIIVDRVSPFAILLGMVVPVLLQYLGDPLMPQQVFFLLIPVLILITLDYMRSMNWYDGESFDLKLILRVWSRYWIVRTLVKALNLLYSLQVKRSWPGLWEVWSDLLVSSCDSAISVIGMNAAFTLVAVMLKESLIEDHEINETEPNSTADRTILWIVVLQFGLNLLEPAQRLERLLQNMYLVLALVLAYAQDVMQRMHCSQIDTFGVDWEHGLLPATVAAVPMLCLPLFLLHIWKNQYWNIRLLAATAFGLQAFLKMLVVIVRFKRLWSRWTLPPLVVTLCAVLTMYFAEVALGTLMIAVEAYDLMIGSGSERHFFRMIVLLCHVVKPTVTAFRVLEDFPNWNVTNWDWLLVQQQGVVPPQQQQGVVPPQQQQGVVPPQQQQGVVPPQQQQGVVPPQQQQGVVPPQQQQGVVPPQQQQGVVPPQQQQGVVPPQQQQGVVLLTEEQLQNTEEVCSICLDGFGGRVSCATSCSHYFHVWCLRRWVFFRQTCPMCSSFVARRPLLPLPPEEEEEAREWERYQEMILFFNEAWD